MMVLHGERARCEAQWRDRLIRDRRESIRARDSSRVHRDANALRAALSRSIGRAKIAGRAHQVSLRAGITRTREFERKRLAEFAVNVGVKCGHDCTYCSSGALLRMHRSFRQVGRSPFESGSAIVDPDYP